MTRLLQYFIPVLLLAGVILGGASLVNANSGHSDWSHNHTQPSDGACAYACILKGHWVHDYNPCGGCRCKG